MEPIKTREEAIARGLKLLSRNINASLNCLGVWLDDDIVMAYLIKKDVYTYRNASKRLRSRKDLALYVVARDGILLDSVENDLNDDFDVVLQAVKNYGFALEFASERLKKNSKIVISAVSQEPRALSHADKCLRKNLNLINYAFSINGPFIVEQRAFKKFMSMETDLLYRFRGDHCNKDEIYTLIEKFHSASITAQEVLNLQEMLLQRCENSNQLTVK